MEHPGAASGVRVPSARDACALIRRPRRSMIDRNEPKTLDGAAQLVRAHVGVALRGVSPPNLESLGSGARCSRCAPEWLLSLLQGRPRACSHLLRNAAH